MKTLDQLIKIAIECHKLKTGETITNTYIRAILWPNSGLFTQRARYSQQRNKPINLKQYQLNALEKTFPYESRKFWNL